MDQGLQERIRDRAYELWTSSGCVHGQADQHWLTAEREILAASTLAVVGQTAAQKKRPARARSKGANTLKAAS